MLSIGSCSGLLEFVQIKKLVAANAEIVFVCLKLTAYYSEHLRSYKLHCNDDTSMCVVKMSDLNDVFVSVQGQGWLMVTLRRFIIC